MKENQNETLMKLYNTDIVGNFRTELVALGYITIKSLGLEKEEVRKIIKEAKIGYNNLALSPFYPHVICISELFYRRYLICCAKNLSLLDVNITSRDSAFIESFMNFLEDKGHSKFEISLITKFERPNVSMAEKITFLRSETRNAGFGTRATNCLLSSELNSVFEIYEYQSGLLKIRNFGDTSLRDIRNKFAENGLNLNFIHEDLIKAAKRPFKTNE